MWGGCSLRISVDAAPISEVHSTQALLKLALYTTRGGEHTGPLVLNRDRVQDCLMGKVWPLIQTKSLRDMSPLESEKGFALGMTTVSTAADSRKGT